MIVGWCRAYDSFYQYVFCQGSWIGGCIFRAFWRVIARTCHDYCHLIPTIKKHLGYVTGITGLQSVGVLILIVLGKLNFMLKCRGPYPLH